MWNTAQNGTDREIDGVKTPGLAFPPSRHPPGTVRSGRIRFRQGGLVGCHADAGILA